MNSRGVIIESIASFEVTWQRVAGQIKWDQNKQSIEIHQSDVYPDLKFTSATARATYVKYVSAARINDLIGAINARIDELMKVSSEEPGEQPKPEQSDNKADQTEGGQVNGNQPGSGADFTVKVYGKRLKFIEGQRNTTTANSEILLRVSTNMQPNLGGDTNNADNIWIEVTTSTGTTKFKMEDFDETVTKFGGNLLVQVLPSIELRFKATEDVYAYGDEESTEIKVTKAVRADLEKLDDDKLKEIEDTILRIRNDRTAKKAKDLEAGKQTANK